MKRRSPLDLGDVLMLVGVALVIGGVAQVSRAAACVLGGLVLLVFGYVVSSLIAGGARGRR